MDGDVESYRSDVLGRKRTGKKRKVSGIDLTGADAAKLVVRLPYGMPPHETAYPVVPAENLRLLLSHSGGATGKRSWHIWRDDERERLVEGQHIDKFLGNPKSKGVDEFGIPVIECKGFPSRAGQLSAFSGNLALSAFEQTVDNLVLSVDWQAPNWGITSWDGLRLDLLRHDGRKYLLGRRFFDDPELIAEMDSYPGKLAVHDQEIVDPIPFATRTVSVAGQELSRMVQAGEYRQGELVTWARLLGLRTFGAVHAEKLLDTTLNTIRPESWPHLPSRISLNYTGSLFLFAAKWAMDARTVLALLEARDIGKGV